MKQKIVIKLQMHCAKGRSKALKIAAVAQGVSSVSLGGADNDQLVVIGDGVDPICLTKSLRKKFCTANILSVEEVKNKGDNSKDKNKPVETKLLLPFPSCYCHQYPPCPPCFICEYQPGSCVIM